MGEKDKGLERMTGPKIDSIVFRTTASKPGTTRILI